ncbi:DUF2911 domain-containing protein [Moheibacter sediminis]|uniref:DUF2911 domain-containing protein n=1 Tax=Moheibacter sediminis TaxID=1434700 RepID=A0A1W1YK01_9FLAO|nr:DUF2911 domain-containing protein [Moheibacter sediminis]SMC36121.1 Protein of unknown function [Moheibacter sediminis]
MKKIFTTLAICALMISVNAQVQTPQASPSSEFEQTVGLTKIEVEYARPNVSGRTVFGDLVPYDKLWRTGANKNSTIEFSDDVVISGQKVKAGKYAIFTKPGQKSWEVYFYSDTENWGLPEKWDDKKVAAKATAEVYPMPMKMETFTMLIDEVQADHAMLGILWENIYVGVKIEVPTEQKVMASIDATMKNSPKPEDYLAAANYYFTANKDIKQAKTWFDEGMKANKEPKFWQLRQQSLIYAKAGDKKGAIDLAKKSLDLAQKAGNADYVKMNETSLKEWGAK